MTPVLAVGDLMALIGSGLILLSISSVVLWVFAALSSDDLEQSDEWRYDVSRINELRKHDAIYRQFNPIVNVLARLNRSAFRESLPEILREIHAAGLSRFWLPEEWLAKQMIVAGLAIPAYMAMFWVTMGSAGFVLALVMGGATAYYLRIRLSNLARRRLTLIKRRIPFLLDLLTLLMEAGSTFMQAMQQGVVEFKGHPVASEFNRVLTDMNLGKTRTEAFTAMDYRLSDDDITSIVGAILQGEELGTPLAHIFRVQADTMRLKRSQRAERLAAEAGVNMLAPAVLVMVSTVLIILGPFILQFLYSGLDL